MKQHPVIRQLVMDVPRDLAPDRRVLFVELRYIRNDDARRRAASSRFVGKIPDVSGAIFLVARAFPTLLISVLVNAW